MNIAVKSALASVVVALAHACATPVEIDDDVLLANPNDFGDAGPLGGAAGDVGQGGTSPAAAGTSGGSSAAGTGGTGAGGAGMPVGLSGAGGLPGAGGAGGAAAGGSGSGVGGSGLGGSGGGAAGTGGTGAGTAGAGVTAGSGGTASSGGAGGSGGTGSAVPVFSVESCDFSDTTGCEALSCETRCPTNDGGSCSSRCIPLVDCVADEVASDSACVTEADPLCGGRDNGTPRACTNLADSAGGAATTNANQPAFVAREFVECVCSLPRP